MGGALLNGIRVARHQLWQCTVIERTTSGAVGGAVGASQETRRHYRLHKYRIYRHKSDGTVAQHGVASEQLPTGTAAMATATATGTGSATGTTATATAISLAFPVTPDATPLRSTEGELIYAYLPVTAVGLGFAIHADFELVASRQEVSDSHAANHVLLGRIPNLFVHAVLSDPSLGEDAFPICTAALELEPTHEPALEPAWVIRIGDPPANPCDHRVSQPMRPPRQPAHTVTASASPCDHRVSQPTRSPRQPTHTITAPRGRHTPTHPHTWGAGATWAAALSFGQSSGVHAGTAPTINAHARPLMTL